MKSHESEYLELWHTLYLDACAKCAACYPDLRDLETVRARVKEEGVSFLTITLPSLGSDLEMALASGSIDPTHFRSFRKYGKAPAFLRGFFDLIFDHGTGGILHANSEIAVAVGCVRQLAYAFKKLKLECASIRTLQALEGFSKIEHNFRDVTTSDYLRFNEVSSCLWAYVLADLPSVYESIPKHGPGATVEGASGNRKYLMQRWHERLEPYFPFYHFAFSSESAYGSEEVEKVTFVAGADEQPVKVIPVPKTLKGPRIIAIEPVCMQYTQQAISAEIVKRLESHDITRGHINFSDQTVNRELAITSSKTGDYATIDLSSASDRVPLSLSMLMFNSQPDYQGAIFACRSRKALMPSGEIIHLRKFASMGSALCFPIEAMYFYTICIMALLKEQNLPVTIPAIKLVSRKVYVYGDDIIVPTTSAAIVIDYLHKYHCKVNVRKSFFSGLFRESCGMDAFMGEEVTPTYIRESFPNDRRDSSALISLIETSNLLYSKGYWRASSYIIGKCEKILGTLPIIGGQCGAVGKISFQRWVSATHWDRKHHCLKVKAWVPTEVRHKSRISGYNALTKCMLMLERKHKPSFSNDELHLSESPRHGAVALKRRWVLPY